MSEKPANDEAASGFFGRLLGGSSSTDAPPIPPKPRTVTLKFPNFATLSEDRRGISGRSVTLFLSFVWGIISFGVGINALVQGRHLQARIKLKIPSASRSTIDVNIDDIFSTGVLITLLSGFIAIFSLLFLTILRYPTLKLSNLEYRKLSLKSTGFQAGILVFLVLWLFTVLVPYTHFSRTHSAQARIMLRLSTTSIRASTSNIANTNNFDPKYSVHQFFQILAIIPWFTLFFTGLAAGVTYRAGSTKVSDPES
ncbi:hypothetical protein C8J56DRAFT_1059305 [Mycena floridula]|nr:hypothetical protein C8J56DRAFT_1059305 [Mycena floridula]